MSTYFTNAEIKHIKSQQLFSLERKIHRGEFSIESIGEYLPGILLVIDLSKFATVYMNKSGCDNLLLSLEELQELGAEYFQQFFVPEETEFSVRTYLNMQQKQDDSHIYNFAHRVKRLHESFHKWYFACAKLLYSSGQQYSDKVLLMVNEVNSSGQIAKKINSVLEESDWIKKNFKRFCNLTNKEKEIITLLVSGKSSLDIAGILGISQLTVNTHRRNIVGKLEAKNFAALYKFAVNFGLTE